jgi:hypothetical protein
MDKKEQQERIMKAVQTVAMMAIELPQDARPSFIKSEIDELRLTLQGTGETDRAAEFSDKMNELIVAMVKILESSGGKTGTA